MTTETNSAFNTVKEAFAPMTDALKNIQNLEVPEAAREFVKKTAGTAMERAADLYAGSERAGACLLDCSRQPVGFHLRPDLRHIVPEHDDIVLLAINVPHMVAQERFGLEAEAFEQRDRRLLIDRHLYR